MQACFQKKLVYLVSSALTLRLPFIKVIPGDCRLPRFSLFGGSLIGVTSFPTVSFLEGGYHELAQRPRFHVG